MANTNLVWVASRINGPGVKPIENRSTCKAQKKTSNKDFTLVIVTQQQQCQTAISELKTIIPCYKSFTNITQ